jgi:hypothetical protein
MLLSLIVGNFKLGLGTDFQWHNIHTKFCENRLICSQVENWGYVIIVYAA